MAFLCGRAGRLAAQNAGFVARAEGGDRKDLTLNGGDPKVVGIADQVRKLGAEWEVLGLFFVCCLYSADVKKSSKGAYLEMSSSSKRRRVCP
jgi:hypothetical protein